VKPRILVVDDETVIAENLRLTLEREGHDVETAGNTVGAMLRMETREFALAVVDLILPDGDGLHLLRLLKAKDPSIEVIIMTGHGSISKAVEATAYGEMLGSSPAIKRVFEMLESVAASDANVLIVGDSGTGKELAANAVHAKSTRVDGPLVKINCAALPKDLIESELFGHVKGAFTGASTDKPGLLEEAHRGSLLLDEITEMPLDLQAKLLRVLEDRTVRRLGGAKTVPVDFRLICSTNREPEAALREGRLRQDLYFRINTVTVALPSLRDRSGDIPLLAKSFLERFRIKHGRDVEVIDPEAYRRLLSYAWPGNIRELEHAIERAVLVARGKEITLADLPEPLQVDPSPGGSAPPPGSLEEIERVSIVRALESTGWNKQAAAQVLGLRRPTLYSKMRRHGIPQRRA
jgi:DNA-binding NtrC family response regulator